MFSPFSPGDSLRVYRLQHRGVSLDLQRGLTQAGAPLRQAWLAYLTQQAMGQPTYVLFDPHDGEAFIQIRYRPHQAAADVAYMAPALSENRRLVRAWAALLEGACADAAGRGIERVFANLPETGTELEVFHQAGFLLYSGEEVYRLVRQRPAQRAGLDLAMRPQRPEDWPALQKLCVTITPQRVRQAEGGISLAADESKQCQRYVLPGDSGEELAAALVAYSGGLAHWLRLLVHPEARGLADGLLEWGLSVLGDQTPRPVYCAVRKYEGGIRGALEAAGFEPLAARALVVKHTVALAKVGAQELVAALKGTAEPVPPALRIESERGRPCRTSAWPSGEELDWRPNHIDRYPGYAKQHYR